MADTFNQNDHDTLIRLAAQVDAHLQRESEVARATLSEIGKISTKLDQLYEASIEQRRDIKDMQTRQRNDDLRIATLEQQVESLQDAADKQHAIAEAFAKASDRNTKQWSVASGLIVFLISNGHTILAWLGRIFSTP